MKDIFDKVREVLGQKNIDSIEVPQGKLFDTYNDIEITWITFYDEENDYTITCFSHDNSAYYCDIQDLNGDDYEKLINFLEDWYDNNRCD